MSRTGRIIRLAVIVLVVFFLMVLFDQFSFRFCDISYNGICWPN